MLTDANLQTQTAQTARIAGSAGGPPPPPPPPAPAPASSSCSPCPHRLPLPLRLPHRAPPPSAAASPTTSSASPHRRPAPAPLRTRTAAEPPLNRLLRPPPHMGRRVRGSSVSSSFLPASVISRRLIRKSAASVFGLADASRAEILAS